MPVAADADPDAVRRTFESAYAARYAVVQPGAPLELVSLVLTGRSQAGRVEPQRLASIDADADGRPAGRRSVYFGEVGRRLEATVYRRSRLPVGFSAAGPALVEEYGSTTVVGPHDHVRVGVLGELRVTFEGAQA